MQNGGGCSQCNADADSEEWMGEDAWGQKTGRRRRAGTGKGEGGFGECGKNGVLVTRI